MLYLMLRPAIRLAFRVCLALLGGVRVEGVANVPRSGRLIVTPEIT